jgi:phenylalanine--tRNA ligase, alpha subunit
VGSFPFLPEKRRISARAENTVPGLKNGIGAENEPFPFRAAGLKPGEIPRRVGFDGLPTIRAQTRLGGVRHECRNFRRAKRKQVVQRRIISPCSGVNRSRADFLYCCGKKNKARSESRMQKEIEELKTKVTEALKETKAVRALYDLKLHFQSELKGISGGMKDLPKEERPAFGKLLNEFKNGVEAMFEERAAVLKEEEMQKKYEAERVDITLPGKTCAAGALHPITLVKNQLIDIFAGMGFKVFEGPEIETDYYNFTALNTPKDHPARDMQDTFYLSENLLLRTQTSAGQIRVMENEKPPIKILSPGRVFRSDDDATHSPMFHQMEGLVVDEGITLCDLQGMLSEFAKKMFTSATKVRLRPSYFPFTEPSVEVDLSCCECGGKGCRLCKGTGWIEVLGAGMVNRKVLENCGVDPDKYTGFAFGMGIERIAMLKYGINNIKALFENDVRLLRQFAK